MIRTTRTRRGVTLVEMMVAAALCIMGMWLLTWVYQQGLDSFRMGRATADLTAQERMVTSLMTRDLRADHFLEEDGKPNRGRRLSDQTKGLGDGTGYKPPRSGYFWTRSSTTGTTYDAAGQFDSYGFYSSRSSGHFIQFSVILPGGRNDQTFSAEVPAYSGNQFFGTAAEVSYYLWPSGRTANGANQMYDLYRGQRLVGRTFDDASAYNAAVQSSNDAPEVMAVYPGPPLPPLASRRMMALSELGPLATPSHRIVPYVPLPLTSPRYGEDKLMSNILSFEVKYTGTSVSLPRWPTTFDLGNTDYPYDFLPSAAGEFDTHGQPAPNGTRLNIRITGAQVRIRAYDPQTRTTRQTTFTVDL